MYGIAVISLTRAVAVDRFSTGRKGDMGRVGERLGRKAEENEREEEEEGKTRCGGSWQGMREVFERLWERERGR